MWKTLDKLVDYFGVARQMSETVAQAVERFSALSEVFDPPHDALSDRARFCNYTES